MTSMNTWKRSTELAQITEQVLERMGLIEASDYESLRPVVQEVMRLSGCTLPTARHEVARHIRRTRGVIVGGESYRVVSISKLPGPTDAEIVPRGLIAPTEGE